MTQMTTITFIGGGQMAQALISGLQRNTHNPDHTATDTAYKWHIQVVEPNQDTAQKLRQSWPTLHVVTQYSELPRAAAAVIVAVKPQQMATVCQALPLLANAQQPLLISIAAGITCSQLQQWLQGYENIVRVMPNTPALIGKGISVLYAGDTVSAEQKKLADGILTAAGKTLWIENENTMDAVTAVSGSGPAYVFYFIEALLSAAVAVDIPAALQRTLVLETINGAYSLAAQQLASDQSNDNPVLPLAHQDIAALQKLRAAVTSKGGTTEAALRVLEQHHTLQNFIEAVIVARDRSRALAHPSS